MTTNIKLSELSELTTTANLANVILFATNLNESPNVSYYMRATRLIEDTSLAQIAFNRANVAYSTGFNANNALLTSGLAFDKGNSAYIYANTGYYIAIAANSHSIASYNQANTATTKADNSFIHANSSYNFANSIIVYASANFAHSNAAFNKANSAFVHAEGAFNKANSILIYASANFAHSNASFDKANASYVHAEAAFTKANSSTISVQAAFNIANNAVQKTGDDISGIVTAPTAQNGTSNTMLATTAFVQNSINLNNSVFYAPPGIIVMWSGTIATIPTGWALCNGSNGTPDLRDRFIIGASVDDSGLAKTTVTGSYTKTGGTKDAVVVQHNHTASGVTDTKTLTGSYSFRSTDGDNKQTVSSSGIISTGAGVTGYTVNGESVQYASTKFNIDASHSHSVSLTINNNGVSGTNQNLPPYYALAFIMKL